MLGLGEIGCTTHLSTQEGYLRRFGAESNIRVPIMTLVMIIRYMMPWAKDSKEGGKQGRMLG